MPESVRNALVTGAGRRIGAAIARDLARRGFAVAIHCNRSRREADALADAIRADGGRAEVLQADLLDAAAVAGLVAAARAAIGPLTLLVNNASVFEDDSAQTFDPAGFERHFALHVRAPSMLARDLAAQLPPGGHGLVVNVIDQRVWRLTPRYFTYTLSKSALWTATRTLAQALAPRVRVNAIGPGPTLANARQSDADFGAQVGALLLRRGPSLDEFGATVQYLWDAPSVTGQMIAVDGGQHLAWQTPDVTGMAE
ncbi:MAG: SDR family oxidoreductase [Rhizobiaceae bacterium]|nr:SDR family oxidoreductase [Rhizobiaceae bacterium]